MFTEKISQLLLKAMNNNILFYIISTVLKGTSLKCGES